MFFHIADDVSIFWEGTAVNHFRPWALFCALIHLRSPSVPSRHNAGRLLPSAGHWEVSYLSDGKYQSASDWLVCGDDSLSLPAMKTALVVDRAAAGSGALDAVDARPGPCHPGAPVFAVSRRHGASGTGRFCPTLVRPGQQPRARYRAVGIERTIDSQRIALKPFHFIYLLSPLTLWL